MELDNEAMKHQIDAVLWLIDKNITPLDESKEKKEYTRKALTRLVVTCLGMEKRGTGTPSRGGDAA